MSVILARILSYIFHPLLMPTYGILLFFNADPQLDLFIPFNLKMVLTLMTLAFTCILPVLNIWLLVKTKFISSIYMARREERNVSYLTTLIFYIAEYYLLDGTQVFPVIKLLIIGATLSIAAAFVINFWWKISAHMIGIGGMAGALLAVNARMDISLLLPVVLLVAGILGYARLALNAHTRAQVYMGFLTGFFCEWGLFEMVHYS